MFWNLFKKIVSRRKPNGALVLIVPNPILMEQDAVEAIRPKLEDLQISEAKRIVLSGFRNHFTDFAGLDSIASGRMALFAHPSSNLVGFAVGSDGLSGKNILLADWFRLREPWKLLIAHVCAGARVLRRPGWGDVFPHWVSYSEEIEAFVHFDRGRSLWHQVAEGLIGVALDSAGTQEAEEGVRSVYKAVISSVRREINHEEGDLLNLLYFQKALENVSSSEEIYE